MRSAFVLVVLTFAPVTTTVAQTTLAPGTRVRITAPTHFKGRKEGTVQPAALIGIPGQRSDTLLVPLADVRTLDLFAGRKSGALLGAIVGGFVGCIGGAAVTSAANSGLSTMTVDPGAICAVGLVVGGAVGAGIGVTIRHDTWKRMPLEQVGVAVRPLGRGFGLGARLAF